MKDVLLIFAFLTFLFFVITFSVGKDLITVSGKVLDEETGEAVIGAKLILKDKREFVSSDGGIFKIVDVSLGDEIKVISSGYKTKTVTVNSKKLDIELSPDVFVLDELVVTGTRTKRLISDSPVLTEVIHKEQIRESPYQNVGEVLDDAPGLYINVDVRGGVGYSKNLNIQGLDRRRVKVLVDGRPVYGSYAGRMDMAAFGIGGVERIEVVKGPSSSLYGSGAIGGVVNIITQKATKPFSYWTSLIYEADKNWNSNINWIHRFSLKRDSLSLGFNYSTVTDDGHYLRDDDENSITAPVSVGHDVETKVNYLLTPVLNFSADGKLTLRQAQKTELNRSSVENFDMHRFSITP